MDIEKMDHPTQVNQDENQHKGGDMFDSEEESARRDQAKVERAQVQGGQKTDGAATEDIKHSDQQDPEDEMEEKG